MAGSGSRSKGAGRSAGGRVGQSAHAKLLQRLEDEIRHGKKETGIVVMPDGRVVRVAGKQHSVSFTADFLGTVRGATLTHNHPGIHVGRSRAAKAAQLARAGQLTTPFSKNDLAIAERYGLREMRAVGSTRNYSFKPKPGSSGAQTLYSFYDRSNTADAKRLYMQQKEKWARRLIAAQRTGDAARARRIEERWGRVQRGLAAGYTYMIGNQTMRDLRRSGFDITARRGRPLVTMKRR